MSLLTFSNAFLEKFGNIVYPELRRRYASYNKYFKVKSTDAWQTNIETWLSSQIETNRELLQKVCDREGFSSEANGNDDTMQSICAWVRRNVMYTEDKRSHFIDDYWQMCDETLALRTGDCEDGATLIVCLASVAGIQTDRFWLQWGEVYPGAGHCYVAYLRDSDAEEVVIDWCYWWTSLSILFRQWLGADDKYLTVWGTASV